MGNQPVTGVLPEEDEPSLTVDENSYEIHRVVLSDQQRDSLGRPVIVFDGFQMIKDDLKQKNAQEGIIPGGSVKKTYFNNDSTSDLSHSSTEELTRANFRSAENISTQGVENGLHNPIRASDTNLTSNKRPTSLAIQSRSHDRNEEVDSGIASGQKEFVPLVTRLSVSADTLLETSARPNLQQRRSKRPTSLQIPSVLNLPPPSVSAHPAFNTEFSFTETSHIPARRQRSHSMPSSALLELREEPLPAKRSLDESLALISKKKITKKEIDEQSLLHRAADAGHVKLLKKCINAGCSINQRLDPLNGTTALHCAVRADKNASQVTKVLLDAGIEVDATNDLGETAIFSAIIHKNIECVDQLVEHGCDINRVWQDSSPLYLLLHGKSYESSKKMIEKGANITQGPGCAQQPLHAVLELIHSQPITMQTLSLLKLMVQADGNIVQHLDSYTSTKPGASQQDIIYHIYKMPIGPEQEEGKRIIRSLFKLGYEPSRGELSTISSTDDDGQALYSYVKSPSPLKDLCIRAVRKTLRNNVIFATDRLHSLDQARKQQILLLPPPEPDYENVFVLRRSKERKSHRKSLKSFMSGLRRSLRLSKKSQKNETPLSLPKVELTKRQSGSLPSGINKTDFSKHKFIKREKKTGGLTVADVIKRYSNSDGKTSTSSSEENLAPEPVKPESSVKYSSRITITDHYEKPSDDTSVQVNFHDSKTLDRNYKFSAPIDHPPTPMKDHIPLTSGNLSYTVYKSSIHVDDDC